MRYSREELAQMTSDFLRENSYTHSKRCRGPKEQGGRFKRDVKAKKWRQDSIKTFVEKNRHSKERECIFVPGATEGQTVHVRFCGRDIPASRYMCLLTHGTPKSEGMFARHLCGNGHLSCVNPNHIAWGTPGDNISDMVKHRNALTDHPLDRMNAL